MEIRRITKVYCSSKCRLLAWRKGISVSDSVSKLPLSVSEKLPIVTKKDVTLHKVGDRENGGYWNLNPKGEITFYEG